MTKSPLNSLFDLAGLGLPGPKTDGRHQRTRVESERFPEQNAGQRLVESQYGM